MVGRDEEGSSKNRLYDPIPSVPMLGNVRWKRSRGIRISQTPTGREIIGSDLRTALLSREEVFRTKFIPRREAHGSRGPSSWRPQLRRRLRYYQSHAGVSLAASNVERVACLEALRIRAFLGCERGRFNRHLSSRIPGQVARPFVRWLVGRSIDRNVRVYRRISRQLASPETKALCESQRFVFHSVRGQFAGLGSKPRKLTPTRSASFTSGLFHAQVVG
ncbi:hypothetical protein V1478_004784 [Vespula squamosa]|uniref:Ribosomal protein S4 n=1 Tax=Vespula squamosa TaxID=30214 RepID=A0ABD2BES6_VESSQ